MTNERLNRLEKCFWPKGFRRNVWMIVDGARDPGIFRMLLGSSFERSCLFSGQLTPALEVAAPYLLQLEFEERHTRRLIEQAWGNSWGVFLKCDTNLEKLRRHLRGFLRVRGPEGNHLLFRYYDPRVLRVYLPTCTSEELRTVFGPVECFWIENQNGDTLLEYEFDQGRLIEREIPLGAGWEQSMAGRSTPTPDRESHSARGGLAIREEQFAAHADADVQQFEDWMLAHLNQFFPRECRALGERGVRDTVRHGVKRARSHGITVKRDVCKFIHVMVVCGRDFETDARLDWAGQILERPVHPAVKVAALHEAAKKHLRRG